MTSVLQDPIHSVGLRDLWGKSVDLPDIVLTSAANANDDAQAQAEKIANFWRVSYVERKGRPISRLFADLQIQTLIVYCGPGDVRMYDSGLDAEPFFYHPGIAILRLKQLLAGGQDRLLRVTGIRAGDSVLDGTAGLCADAAVMAYATGQTGSCVAFEASPAVALVVAMALSDYKSGVAAFDAALRRIDLRCATWQAALTQYADDAVDVVYLDPMFSIEKDSAGIRPLRRFAHTAELTQADLAQALRVARKAVVIKDGWPGPLLKKLGIRPDSRSRKSTLYGCVLKGE